MRHMNINEKYMHRALQLARLGAGNVSPNPMVGAVIIHDPSGRIIGEGFHRRWGQPHAEVNAVASVKDADLPLLGESTIYVTLEPCSHYGKTPPCAKMLIERGIPRIAVGAMDPFPEVAGRGVEMLRHAGREVTTGVLEEESIQLNRRFMTAHRLQRPWVQLKWAESADGFIASAFGEPVKLSSARSMVAMHRERSMADAIMVGPGTVVSDNPRLDCRLWPGRKPIGVTMPFRTSGKEIPQGANIFQTPHILRNPNEGLVEFLHRLYTDHKITSLMVEGGAATLQEFLDAGIYDEIRRETSPLTLHDGIKSPHIN